MHVRAAAGRTAAFCLLAAIGAAEPIRAQDTVHLQAVLGGGVSYAGGSATTTAGPGLAGHLGLRYYFDNLVLSVRAGMNFGGSAPERIPGGLRDRFDEIALMAGYPLYRAERSQVVLSTGIAAVSGERVGTGPAPYFGATNVPFDTRVGFPLELSVSAPGGGFGLAAHVDFNPEEVFGAFTVTYLIGPDDPRGF